MASKQMVVVNRNVGVRETRKAEKSNCEIRRDGMGWDGMGCAED